jgi:hypothetical protein
MFIFSDKIIPSYNSLLQTFVVAKTVINIVFNITLEKNSVIQVVDLLLRNLNNYLIKKTIHFAILHIFLRTL